MKQKIAINLHINSNKKSEKKKLQKIEQENYLISKKVKFKKKTKKTSTSTFYILSSPLRMSKHTKIY